MNADNAEVLRSGGSSGVAGISTFMSRTRSRAARHRSGRRPDSSAKGLESERMYTQGTGSHVGQLGKLRPIVNRPNAAFALHSGGCQPPAACPTSRQRFHFYVAHPAPRIVVSHQTLQIAREPSGVGNRERRAAVAELAKVYGILRPLPGSFLPALPRS